MQKRIRENKIIIDKSCQDIQDLFQFKEYSNGKQETLSQKVAKNREILQDEINKAKEDL